MIKKKYIKPTTQIVEIQQRTTILIGSPDEYGMNNELITDDIYIVEEGW